MVELDILYVGVKNKKIVPTQSCVSVCVAIGIVA